MPRFVLSLFLTEHRSHCGGQYGGRGTHLPGQGVRGQRRRRHCVSGDATRADTYRKVLHQVLIRTAAQPASQPAAAPAGPTLALGAHPPTARVCTVCAAWHQASWCRAPVCLPWPLPPRSYAMTEAKYYNSQEEYPETYLYSPVLVIAISVISAYAIAGAWASLRRQCPGEPSWRPRCPSLPA